MATKKPQIERHNFLASFEKDIAGVVGIGESSAPPRYWHSFGNHVVNKIMSGSYVRGIPQGRITGIVGPSGAGKSFISGNCIRNAQRDGAIVLVVDSENALDDGYMHAVGVNTGRENQYYYRGVSTVGHVIKVISTFIKNYRSEFGNSEDAPKVIIVVDSLGMLQTESAAENYNKGVQKGDQGQGAKQVKGMLRDFVQDIKDLNISIVVTGHVYRNTDPLNGEGVWIVNDGMRFSLSQILQVTKLKHRDKDTKVYDGIELKAFGYKTRFTKPFQSASIIVPYDRPLDPYSGLLEAAVAAGVVYKPSSGWYAIRGEENKWRAADFEQYALRVLEMLEQEPDVVLEASVGDDDDEQDTAASPQ